MADQINTERKQIKDFKIALKDFEPLVKDARWLINGRKFSNFSLLPREAWANWLLCVVLRKIKNRDITFIEDEEGDGIIIDKGSGMWVQTEHVSALNTPSKKPLPPGEERVIQAINHKIKRGTEYARNKFLIVFFDGAGQFYRNKIRESIRGRHGFLMVYSIGLLSVDDFRYTYAITEYHDDISLTFKVEINEDFTDWTISQIIDPK